MPGPGNLFDDVVQDLKKNAIEKWDYSSLFPASNPDGTAYTSPKGPLFVTGWPYQIDAQLMTVKNGQQLTQPIISIYAITFDDADRTLGDIYQSGVGTGPLQLRLGRRAAPTILISCWADQQLGGMDMVRRLAGYVYSALFYYRNSLQTIRGINLLRSREEMVDPAMLYRCDLTITGRSLVTIDV